jgi:aspartokinase-like uncharacterized kinase
MNIDVVFKVGGGLLKQHGDLDRVLAVISDRACVQRVLIVPGGGPFADAVRAVDKQVGLSDDAAHWMAIRAMDQYAHVIADRMPGCALVSDLPEIEAALTASRVPVLTPYQWLRDVDPLPHSWDVTSDSIAAWVAGAIGAPRLVLIKPSGAVGTDLVDPYFQRALPPDVSFDVVAADRLDALASLLGAG